MTKSDLTAIIFTLTYTIGSNFLLLYFANLGVGIDCTSPGEEYLNTSTDFTETNVSEFGENRANILDLAMGRCEGLPFLFYAILELPAIVGILFIGRKFIGFS